MNIAVVHNLPPGGQKRALYEQIKILSRKHKVDVYTLSTSVDSFNKLPSTVNGRIITNFNYHPRFPLSLYSIYFTLPKIYHEIADKINKLSYDVAYVGPCFLTQSPYILRYLKIPTLYSCAEPKREFYEQIPRNTNNLTYKLTFPFRYPLKFIDIQNARAATRILANSNYAKKMIDKIYKVRSIVNYLGVDTDKFKPQKVKKENMVLMVGELSLHKGQDFLIRSLVCISPSLRPKLVIIGHSGHEQKYLKKLAHDFNVNLEIIENINDKMLLVYYNKAKLFLYAAVREPFGLVILEAAACGTPIIAVDEGGVGEILKNNLFGETVIRDYEKFAQVTEEWLKGNKKLTNISNLRNNIIKNWSWENSVTNLEKHLLEIAQK